MQTERQPLKQEEGQIIGMLLESELLKRGYVPSRMQLMNLNPGLWIDVTIRAREVSCLILRGTKNLWSDIAQALIDDVDELERRDLVRRGEN